MYSLKRMRKSRGLSTYFCTWSITIILPVLYLLSFNKFIILITYFDTLHKTSIELSQKAILSMGCLSSPCCFLMMSNELHYSRIWVWVSIQVLHNLQVNDELYLFLKLFLISNILKFRSLKQELDSGSKFCNRKPYSKNKVIFQKFKSCNVSVNSKRYHPPLSGQQRGIWPELLPGGQGFDQGGTFDLKIN